MERGEALQTFRRIQEEVKTVTKGVVIKTETFRDYYLPIIQHYINDRENKKLATYVVGLQGGQGAGKTVLASVLKLFLKSINYKIAVFSMDDFYKSNDKRLEMAKTYEGNSFYQISRGMPGTHEYGELFDTLKKAKNGENFEIPCFEKSLHEGRGDVIKNVVQVRERQDFVMLEGWHVNMPYVETGKFLSIMKQNSYVYKVFNEIDPRQEYFKVVMDYNKKYQKIWELFDNRTVLLGKNIEWIKEWREEQEERLISSKGSGMTSHEIAEFIKPFIPFSYLLYDEAVRSERNIDCLLTIEKDHLPEDIKFPIATYSGPQKLSG